MNMNAIPKRLLKYSEKEIEGDTQREHKFGIGFIDFYGKIKFEPINAKVSCKCRNKLHLALRMVVLIFSVQSERKLCPF